MGVIYGTNISMKSVTLALEDFIMKFELIRRSGENESASELVYR